MRDTPTILSCKATHKAANAPTQQSDTQKTNVLGVVTFLVESVVKASSVLNNNCPVVYDDQISLMGRLNLDFNCPDG